MLLWLLPAVLAALIAIVTWNAVTFTSKQTRVQPVVAVKPLPGFEERLAHSLRFPTISSAADTGHTAQAFHDLHEFLRTSYPRVHAHLERELHGGHSLLYRWKGADSSGVPILLMSHLDVVPVESGTESSWTHAPFSGDLADGFIWGRGALDVKCGALGLLEAAERLLEIGFSPAGDVYFALGHDEEIGGREGNQRMAEILRGRGVRFRFVLDEGGGLTEGIIDGINGPVAFVGIAEKGFATIRLKARAEGGHSSMPPAAHGRGDDRQRGDAAGVESVPRTDRRGNGRDARLSRTGDALASSTRAGESLAYRRTHRPAVRRQGFAQRSDPNDDGSHGRPWR